MPRKDRVRSRSLESPGRGKGSRPSSAVPMPNRRLSKRGCAPPRGNSLAISSLFYLVNAGLQAHQCVLHVAQILQVARKIVASRSQLRGQAPDNPVLHGTLKVDDDVAAEAGMEPLDDTPAGPAQVDAPEADCPPQLRANLGQALKFPVSAEKVFTPQSRRHILQRLHGISSRAGLLQYVGIDVRCQNPQIPPTLVAKRLE